MTFWKSFKKLDPDEKKPADATARLIQALNKSDHSQSKTAISEGADVNAKDKDGRTVLFIASTEGHSALVNLLLEHGANPNVGWREDVMPLHAAAKGTDIDVVRALVEGGANIKATMANGDLPVDVALECGRKYIVKYLYEMDQQPKRVEAAMPDTTDRNSDGSKQHILDTSAERENFPQMGFLDRLSGKSRQISTESSDELIRNLETLADLFPSDPKASKELLFVLVSLEEAEPQATWPAPLREVIARGEDVIDILIGGLEEGDPIQITGRKLYFAVALCYIQSPRVVEPLCRLLEQDRETSTWPSPPEERVIIFDAIEMIYIATARAFYWAQARDILSRLRAIVEKGQQKTMLNALPYALRALGFIGDDTDMELVQQFVFFDCPEFDLSEVRVRFEAKHAIHALRHPKERDVRANTRPSTWASD